MRFEVFRVESPEDVSDPLKIIFEVSVLHGLTTPRATDTHVALCPVLYALPSVPPHYLQTPMIRCAAAGSVVAQAEHIQSAEPEQTC